jgi:hypothetical protein
MLYAQIQSEIGLPTVMKFYIHGAVRGLAAHAALRLLGRAHFIFAHRILIKHPNSFAGKTWVVQLTVNGPRITPEIQEPVPFELCGRIHPHPHQ